MADEHGPETIDVSAARLRRGRDGVVEVRVREGAVVELAEMEEILAAQLELVRGPTVVLVDARPVRSMSRAAQQRTAETAAERGTLAVAILVESPVSVLLGNFYLRLSRPVYPTRLFRDEAEARAWLLTQRPEAADG